MCNEIMSDKTKDIKKDIDYICRNMIKPFQLEKIYIDNLNYTHLEWIFCIPPHLIEENSRFVNDNDKELKGIISLKKKYNINHLYIEMDFNFVKYIDFFDKYSISESDFIFIENNSLIKKVLERKRKLYDDRVIIKELIDFICLFDHKKAIKIIQYMRYNNLFNYCIIKNVFDGYINIIDKDSIFCQFNNFRYIRDAALHPFSLNDLDFYFSK